VGAILVASSKKGIVAILLGNDPDKLVRDLQDRFPKAKLVGADKGYEALVARVIGFAEVPGRNLELPLDIRGTALQHKVWRALREIAVGKTRFHTPNLHARLAHRRLFGPLLEHAEPTILRWPSRAIGLFETTGLCPDIRGASSANVGFLIGKGRG
jgi:hypothetical protein